MLTFVMVLPTLSLRTAVGATKYAAMYYTAGDEVNQLCTTFSSAYQILCLPYLL